MRTVSPVFHADTLLIFTSPASQKYRQLRDNPRCCVVVGGFFGEATAAFIGATMPEANAPLRRIYATKLDGAYENFECGGRNAEFVLIKPIRIKG